MVLAKIMCRTWHPVLGTDRRGGISNGITGKDGSPDGSGIDFKTEAEGNEWRWTEQWIPHAAWFLQAVAATAQPVVLSNSFNINYNIRYLKKKHTAKQII
jgi:hypothetical protein